MFYTVLICLLASIGAGLGTGLAGLSAAAVISPMLIAFLKVPAYEAIGVALASDVLASAVSAYTYGKHKNIDIKNGLVMMGTVLVVTVLSSKLASFVPNVALGGLSVSFTLLVGLKFLFRPVMATKESMAKTEGKKRFLQSVLTGIAIGFVCGFVGAGGGMMLLLALTSLLGYELKTAVGTSTFIMAFTAFTGAASHFAIGGTPDWTTLLLCVVFTLLFARLAAKFANKADAVLLNRVTGIFLTVLGAVILFMNYIMK